MEAYKAVEAWVRATQVPASPAPIAGLEKLSACAVTLRLDHHVIGRAFDFGGGPDSLVRVARAAIAQAVPHLPVGHDALAEEQLREAAAKITISLELAGTIIPTKFATFAEANAVLQPGLDGVCARFGDKIAGCFPSEMLTLNKTPGEALATAISDASGDPLLAIPGSIKGEPGAIADERKATYYRFRAMHLAQTDEERPPSFLFRGGRVIGENEVTMASLRSFADDLADNLKARASAGAGGRMAGTYLPAKGTMTKPLADTLEQVLAAMALVEYADLVRVQNLPVDKPEDALDKEALTVAADLLDGTRADAMKDPVAAGAWLIVADALERLEPGLLKMDAATQAQMEAGVASAYDAQTGWLKEIPVAGHALISLALVTESQAPGVDLPEQARRRTLAEAAVRSIYRDTDPKMLVSHMPWLGRAEIALAGDAKAIPADPALRDQREMVWKHQLTFMDAGDDGPDLVGGIVFVSSRNPLPTWQTVRPIIFLAQMARDKRLTDPGNEKLAEISHLLGSMRFLRQLMLDDDKRVLGRESQGDHRRRPVQFVGPAPAGRGDGLDADGGVRST